MDFTSELGKRSEKLLSWARYLSWAELTRRYHRERLDSHAHHGVLDRGSVERDAWPLFALLAYSYASLYVAIEGYEQLGFKDSQIDELLLDSRKALLKRFRNGAFHFQKRFIDDKFVDLITKEDHVQWVSSLHDELVRFFLEQLNTFNGTPDEIVEVRKAATEIVGWAGWDT